MIIRILFMTYSTKHWAGTVILTLITLIFILNY